MSTSHDGSAGRSPQRMRVSDEGGVRTSGRVVGCGYWGSKHVRTLMSLEAVSSVC